LPWPKSAFVSPASGGCLSLCPLVLYFLLRLLCFFVALPPSTSTLPFTLTSSTCESENNALGRCQELRETVAAPALPRHSRPVDSSGRLPTFTVLYKGKGSSRTLFFFTNLGQVQPQQQHGGALAPKAPGATDLSLPYVPAKPFSRSTPASSTLHTQDTGHGPGSQNGLQSIIDTPTSLRKTVSQGDLDFGPDPTCVLWTRDLCRIGGSAQHRSLAIFVFERGG